MCLQGERGSQHRSGLGSTVNEQPSRRHFRTDAEMVTFPSPPAPPPRPPLTRPLASSQTAAPRSRQEPQGPLLDPLTVHSTFPRTRNAPPRCALCLCCSPWQVDLTWRRVSLWPHVTTCRPHSCYDLWLLKTQIPYRQVLVI